jgi:hypothetical protein
MRLFLGKSTPAILANVNPPLSLPLFMPFVFADHPHNPFATYNFTFGADFFD